MNSRRGIGYVDAPVMGACIREDATPISWRAAILLVERCRPLFEALGRKLMRAARGSGHMLKSLANTSTPAR